MIGFAQILAGLGIIVSGMLAALHPPHTPLPAAEPVVAGPAPVVKGGDAPRSLSPSSQGPRSEAPAVIAPQPQGPVASQRVVSTAYCPNQGSRMADGSLIHEGAVAMGTIRRPWPPFGSRVRVLTGPLAGAVLVVQDRIGWGSQFDVFMWDCWAARRYGLQRILIAPI